MFNKNTNNLQELCIRPTCDGKIIPIQYAAMMMRYVTIVVVPLPSEGLYQDRNTCYSCDDRACVFAEHLDSICEDKDIAQMRLF